MAQLTYGVFETDLMTPTITSWQNLPLAALLLFNPLLKIRDLVDDDDSFISFGLVQQPVGPLAKSSTCSISI